MSQNSKTNVMNVMPQGIISEKKSEDKKNSGNIPIFNMNNWVIWLIGFLVPVIVLGAVPLGKFLTNPEYTGIVLLSDIFSNFGIIMISVSMMLAAVFELNAANQIPNCQKTKIAFLLTIFLLLFVTIGITIYIAVIMVDTGWNEPLLMGRVIKINIFLFIISFVFGTSSFFRGILWN